MRLRLILVHTIAMLLASVSFAVAVPLRDGDPSLFNVLSVAEEPGALPSEAELVQAALAMPSVTKATAALQGMGLQRSVVWDRGYAEVGTYLVGLGFQSPEDPNLCGALFIVTTHSDELGWDTRVFGGAYLWDGAAGGFSVAPESYESVVVEINNLASMAPSNYPLARSPAHKFYDFVMCTAGECITMTALSAFCGPGAPVCATIGCHVAVVHCAFHEILPP